jgi:hypothetical protein
MPARSTRGRRRKNDPAVLAHGNVAQMDYGRANEIATRWVRAHGEQQQQAQGALSAVGAFLMGVFQEADPAAIVEIDGLPTVAVLAADTLYRVTANATGAEGAGPIVRCKGLRLDPSGSEVSVEETIVDRGPGTTVRRRVWTFEFHGGDAVTLTTNENVRGLPPPDPGDQPEVLARAVANALGWSIPDEDASLGAFG